jgi:hypothetical protein
MNALFWRGSKGILELIGLLETATPPVAQKASGEEDGDAGDGVWDGFGHGSLWRKRPTTGRIMAWRRQAAPRGRYRASLEIYRKRGQTVSAVELTIPSAAAGSRNTWNRIATPSSMHIGEFRILRSTKHAENIVAIVVSWQPGAIATR